MNLKWKHSNKIDIYWLIVLFSSWSRRLTNVSVNFLMSSSQTPELRQFNESNFSPSVLLCRVLKRALTGLMCFFKHTARKASAELGCSCLEGGGGCRGRNTNAPPSSKTSQLPLKWFRSQVEQVTVAAGLEKGSRRTRRKEERAIWKLSAFTGENYGTRWRISGHRAHFWRSDSSEICYK